MVRIRIPGAVGGVVKGAGVLDDLADIIRDPPPTPVGGAIGRAGQKFCDYLSAAPALAFGILQSQGVIGAIVCDPYLNDSGQSPPQPEPPPFEGGQCDAVYRVTGTYLEYFSDCTTANRTIDIQLRGPLGTLQKVDGPDPTCPDAEARGYFIETGLGPSPIVGPSNAGFSKPAISVAREDSLADDCGDLPPDIVPGPTPAPLPPNYQPGIDFGIDGDGQPFFDVPGIENPFGEPIPFEDPFSSPPAAPSVPQPSGDNSPGEPDSVGNPIGGPVGGDSSEDISFGEPPMGKIWVGCLVEFTVDQRYGSIPNTGPENTVYPLTVGNVSLRYGSSRGTSQQIRSRWTEVFRPNTAVEVTGVFVQTRPNSSAIVRPISVTVCKAPSCLGE